LNSHTYVLRVQCSCGVVLVFWFYWQEIVFSVIYILNNNTVVQISQFFAVDLAVAVAVAIAVAVAKAIALAVAKAVAVAVAVAKAVGLA
jgi:hypothetical protein